MDQGADDICRGCKRLTTIGRPLRGRADPAFADISDLDLVDRLSDGRVDLTYGR